jgi:acetyl esterase/lipase
VYNKAPVVLYIHGGAWIAGMKEGLNFNRFNSTVSDLRKLGYAIVSIDYTLADSNRGPFPACVQDAVDAVIWIHENADAYDLDVTNLGLFGESAGAQIAMMVGFGHPAVYLSDRADVHFQYVVDIYGPTKLQDIYHDQLISALYSTIGNLPATIQSHLDFPKYIFGFDPRTDSVRAAELMETYSPYNYVTSTAPPTLLIQGDVDRVVPVSQSIMLQAKLDSFGVENEIHIVEGADHAFANATQEQKSILQQQIVEFILRHYSVGRGSGP